MSTLTTVLSILVLYFLLHSAVTYALSMGMVYNADLKTDATAELMLKVLSFAGLGVGVLLFVVLGARWIRSAPGVSVIA